ncbi:MAG TPA: fumarylacetoacetate hydrolase family protein [Acidobacteriaceae bacterium]|nr:fumarylacetoacetate hydrolase family protein [Acidobacteriaceae bacterium]
MKLITFRRKTGAAPEPGVLQKDTVYPLTPLGYTDAESFLAGGAAALASARSFISSAGTESTLPLSSVQLLSPLLNPPRIFCVGLNYQDHAKESKMAVQAVPTIFMKLASSITGPDSNVVLPANSTQPDYEAELAVVIGSSASNVTRENWRECVFGYTILNDVSARDVQLATTQWTLGKSFPTFCPIGPWVVTADELTDPHTLDVRLTIDGGTLQQANTRDLIFDIPAVLGYISAIVALEPGDIVSTGTPQGVGLGRTPQRWMRPGEEVAIEISGIGRLVNHTVAGK